MVYLVICLVIGLICAGFAIKKGKSAVVWFFLGLLLGPIGLICAMFTPKNAQSPENIPSQVTKK